MSLSLFIKKFITFFIEPLGFILTLLALGIYFLYRKKPNYSKVFLLSAFYLLVLFSYPPFSNFLVTQLETKYEKYHDTMDIHYIHVLGNGHNTDPKQPISSHLSDGGTKRVLEGVLLYKRIPNVKLIFTGYKGDTNTSNAVMNGQLALALGVRKEDIIINGSPEDTKDEALFTKTIVADEPFILVTSATHMSRAMRLFQQLGLHPIAAPTDFQRSEFMGWLQAPNVESFYASETAIHEYIGMLWAKIRG